MIIKPKKKYVLVCVFTKCIFDGFSMLCYA